MDFVVGGWFFIVFGSLPSILAQIEHVGFQLDPFSIPTWLNGGSPLALSPVTALRTYLEVTLGAPQAVSLFVPRL